MNLDDWLAKLPPLHSWDGGKTWCTGGFDRELFQQLKTFCATHLPAQPRILETGAGNSTIFFLFLSPVRLVSIEPDAGLFERIRSYCEAHDIPTISLEAYNEGSEWVLPRIGGEAGALPFDFVLIDGCHNFPNVFLDFFYGNYVLRPGGYIMVDDIQLHPSRELANMLGEQPEFELALDLGKALVYRRRPTADARTLGEWTRSPYIVRRSKEYDPRLRTRLRQLFQRS